MNNEPEGHTRCPPPDGQAAATPDYLGLRDAELVAACNVHTYRASGPGGQKRNKTSSAVRLRHRPTGLTVVATESRSQHENRARAVRRLREAIALNVRRSVDLEHFVLPEAVQACLTRDGRLHVGRRDERYLPAVQAILDLLVATEGRVRDAAQLLELPTAMLSAFLTRDGKLLAEANRIRRTHGRRPLRG
jgi:hypothetical protein